MSKQLPERPDLGQLKKQAKNLLEEVRAANSVACGRAGIEAHNSEAIDGFALHDAQRIIAREHGFASWAKLKLHVETRLIDAAEARLVEAALNGEQDAIDAILAERPELATRSIYVGAALGDEAFVTRELGRDPALAKAAGGPRGWAPLLYVCFGKSGGDDAARAKAASVLLGQGADPNCAWLHVDWPESPLPALYGATGVNDFPRLARVLLQAGADPNDGESRYHAAEHNHVASLEVLRDFGTDFSGADKTWGSTPLAFLLGFASAAPAVREGIRWLLENGADPNVRSLAATVDQTALHAAIAHQWDGDTVRLLLRHGADVRAKRADGRTAYALAIRSGRADLAALVREHGGASEVAPRDEFLGCCMRGDANGARAILDATRGLFDRLTPEDRKLPMLAAKRGRAVALQAFGQTGFDLAAEGDWGEHALHWAAWHGHAEAVRALVVCGVPLAHRDRRFGAPPLGWCGHGSENAHPPAGDYAAVAEALLAAGAPIDGTEGSAEVMAVIRRYRR